MTDRQSAQRMFWYSRHLAIAAIVFLIATLLWPPRPHVLPSEILTVAAAISAVFINVTAQVLWRRDR